MSEREKQKIKGQSHTYSFDKELKLDKFFFLALDPERFRAGNAVLGIELSVLEHDSLVTLEDIFEIVRFRAGLTQWEIDLLRGEKREEVLKEYREQTLEGKHFHEIFCKLLTLEFRETPEEFYSDERVRSRIWDKIRKHLGIEGKYQISPEIKIFGKVPFEKIRGVAAFSADIKKVLLESGVPAGKITYPSSEDRESLYLNFRDLKNSPA